MYLFLQTAPVVFVETAAAILAITLPVSPLSTSSASNNYQQDTVQKVYGSEESVRKGWHLLGAKDTVIHV
jgi:hypothetical protein